MTSSGIPTRYIIAPRPRCAQRVIRRRECQSPKRSRAYLNLGARSNAKRRSLAACALRFFLRLQDLAAAVHAGLEIDVVRTAQLTRVLVLDVGRLLERIGRLAHALTRRRGFLFGDGHGKCS